MNTLRELRVGHRAIVASIETGTIVGQRLLALGIVPGTRLSVTKVAPLGDPIAIEFNGCHVSLRRDEAEGVFIKEETGSAL
ncbi:MAG: ferrous iron transport protein A [Opitutales bacterium]|nr:ferrous iron transport protein A [Opitutales bacterium]